MFNHLLSSMKKLLIATADVKTCMLALLKIPTGPICFLLISDALCAVVASFLPPCSCVFVRVNFVFLSFAGCGRFARPLTCCFYPGACGGTASVPLPMSTHLSSKRRKCSLACSGHHTRVDKANLYLESCWIIFWRACMPEYEILKTLNARRTPCDLFERSKVGVSHPDS
jgi:hypothetical protein